MIGEGSAFPEAPIIKEDIADKKLRLLGARGTLLGEVVKAKKALGDDPKEKLHSFSKNGLNLKEIAERISTEETQVSPFALFVLGRLYIVSGLGVFSRSDKEAKYQENTKILDQVEKRFPEDDFRKRLDDLEYLVYFVRYQLGGPSYSLSQLASDLHISKEKLIKTEDNIFEQLKESLK